MMKIKIEIGITSKDFIEDKVTVRVTFTGPKDVKQVLKRLHEHELEAVISEAWIESLYEEAENVLSKLPVQ